MSAVLSVAAFPASLRDNPYCDLLYRNLAGAGVRVVADGEFSVPWLVHNRRRVDVLHVHWPEFYYRQPGGRVTARSALAFVAAVLVARALGYRLVWTVHNALPHERRALDRALRALLLHTARVVVQARTARAELPRSARTAVVIPHGHYIGVYPDTCSDEEARTVLGLEGDALVFLCFGQLRPYKGVLELVAAFAALPDPQLRLVLAGRVPSPPEETAIRAAAAADARVLLHLDYVADDVVQVFFKAADWVVLPYREVLTSGSAMLALSFARPVIVPRRGALGEIAATGCAVAYEPGEAAALGAALAQAATHDAHMLRPQALATARRCDWPHIARAYAEVFQGA